MNHINNLGLKMPTLRLNDQIWEKLEKGCVEITIIKRKPVNVSEVVKFILSEYSEVGIEKLMEIERSNIKQGETKK